MTRRDLRRDIRIGWDGTVRYDLTYPETVAARLRAALRSPLLAAALAAAVAGLLLRPKATR